MSEQGLAIKTDAFEELGAEGGDAHNIRISILAHAVVYCDHCMRSVSWDVTWFGKGFELSRRRDDARLGGICIGWEFFLEFCEGE
jgi:hypothetical protein